MRNSSVTILLLLAGLLSACSGRLSKTVIEGRADGISGSDPVIAVLFHYEGDVGKQWAVDTLREGRFRFELDSLSESGNHYGIMLRRVHYPPEEKRAYVPEMLCYPPEIYLEPGARVRIKGLARHFQTAKISSPVKDQKLRQRFLRLRPLADPQGRPDESSGGVEKGIVISFTRNSAIIEV